MTRGTIEYNSKGEKVFLPELFCDMFIGIFKPNKMSIDNDGYTITDSIECKESDIVFAELNYHEKTCIVIKHDDDTDN